MFTVWPFTEKFPNSCLKRNEKLKEEFFEKQKEMKVYLFKRIQEKVTVFRGWGKVRMGSYLNESAFVFRKIKSSVNGQW